jgi:phosphoribosylaminoimidazolecarboxamide formyltransferase/IMP cyclohydrolase
MQPCGVGIADDVLSAYRSAYAGDPVSIFGGIVALNREVDEILARELAELFLEIVMAPSFTKGALGVFASKPNLRVLTVDTLPGTTDDALPGLSRNSSGIAGGLLVQHTDSRTLTAAELQVVTEVAPTDEQVRQLLLGWRVVKHVKSNAVVLTRDDRTVGVGAGQMNRVGAANIAIAQAGDLAVGSALASDAFFPMPDTVEQAVAAGVTAIIQPGGSRRDDESIAVANEAGITMVCTGVRHFKH